jgi:hypothetical protein
MPRFIVSLDERVAGGGCPPLAPTPPYVPFGIRRFLSSSAFLLQCLSPFKHPALPFGFRPILPALGSLTRHLLKAIRKSAQRWKIGSALHRMVHPTTTASADFCPPFGTPLSVPSLWQVDRSPGVRRVTFAPSTRRIYARPVRVASGFRSVCPLAHQTDASYAIRVPRARALPTASFPHCLTTKQLLFS